MASKLILGVEGSSEGFPSLAEIAQLLRALDCTSLAPGRTLSPPSVDAFRRHMPPVKYPVVRGAFAPGSGTVDGWGATSPRDEERRQAIEIASASARRAAELGASVLVVEMAHEPGPPIEAPGVLAQVDTRDRMLDRCCRSLFEISSAVPGLRIAVPPPSLDVLADPAAIEAVLDDLGDRRVGYWHDTGRARVLARRGEVSEESWLARLDSRCLGVDLCDAVDEFDGLPAGSGEVDFTNVREALGSEALVVARARPDPGAGPMLEAFRVLRKAGF